MGIKHYRQVWKMELKPLKRETAGYKLLLLALAEFANDAGQCWPSLATLAEMTGFSERHVRRTLRELESLGLIETTVRPGRENTNIYTIKGDELDTKGDELDTKRGHRCPPIHQEPSRTIN